MNEPDKIEVDQFLPYPPAQVWRILVDPDLMARWLMPNDFKPVVGHRFTFQGRPMPALRFAGTIHCEVLAVEPERLLRITWVDRGGSGLDSVVTWRLEPEGRGTRMLMEHSGFDLDSPFQSVAHRTMGSGWRSSVVRSMLTVLEQEA
ncbi:SRPBCC family protein [Micromonospora sp. CA-244673]|uniref:SRPBCC family protein n=1 Tax=Micromonospora sp. CA-244673 TaxID=3239958 RepID=UPI003D90BF5B